MTNKEITDFFRAIKANDLQKIKKFIANDKAYVNVCCGKSPKNDAGQSGLQIAIKRNFIDIAQFLIEQGADVNFIENKNINSNYWPVLNDCVKQVIFLCYFKNAELYTKALNLLNNMLIKGANPKAVDCAGNNSLNRALIEIYIMSKNPPPEFEKMEKIIVEGFREVLKILIEAGADINESNNEQDSAVENIKKFGLDKYNLF